VDVTDGEETAMKNAIPSACALVLALLVVPAEARAGDSPPAPGPTASAAAYPWSVSLGTGAGGYVEFVDAFSNGGPVGYDSSQREGRFQVNARADRQLDRWFRVGVAWTWNRWTDAYYSGTTRVGTIDNSVHSLMADVTLRWYRGEHVELYGALAAGAGRWSQAGDGIGASQDGVQSGFAFQLRYFGINAGNERVRAFVDLGIGMEGLVVGGVTLRF
jgi:hypothetical protein